MQIKIDEELCTGCGVCESMCPEVFKVGDDDKAKVITPNECKDCDCNEVADSCPAEAITIEE